MIIKDRRNMKKSLNIVALLAFLAVSHASHAQTTSDNEVWSVGYGKGFPGDSPNQLYIGAGDTCTSSRGATWICTDGVHPTPNNSILDPSPVMVYDNGIVIQSLGSGRNGSMPCIMGDGWSAENTESISCHNGMIFLGEFHREKP